ncbi:serine/threonine-protein kinase RIO3 [Amyelois transitella]|uniref:serine/threonine-protein kinase RIO3 n=1 Tax=Amyelois transitella TaxID=680683 RepID=UPI00298F72C6|nr:serine/threonine-protein kinase RIO3 [Amyelois transitella]
MSNPWKKVAAPADVQNLSEIMSEQYAKDLQIKEEIKFAEEIGTAFQSHDPVSSESSDISPEILKHIEDSNVKEFCDSDAVIAKVLQCQFDKEYDDEIRRVEKKLNGESKVSVSFENYRHVPDHLIYDSEPEDEDVDIAANKDWDRFETNEKEFANLPTVKNGTIVTKHDSDINGRRNACRVMAFPPEVCTGDGAGFDMKLSNAVFNQLKESTRVHQPRKITLLDKKDAKATAVMAVDEATKLILYKLVYTTNLLEAVNGVISTGKEAVVFHADGNTSYPDLVIPKECAAKVFKTTLCEFKTRDKYIEADYRFKDRFSKQNPWKIVQMWAEKEKHNLIRMQKIGMNCPQMICLKKNVLLMSFIGRDITPAPKLKDVILDAKKWQRVYIEVIDAMYKLYNEGHLIHADLSEYNILWWENKCWFIDVSQSVQPDYPKGLDFLLRDCQNITNFFEKKGVQNMKSVDKLFKWITGFDDVDVNLLDGVHTIYNSLSSRFEIAPDDNRNVSYPFEYCWQKTNEGRMAESDNEEDEFDEMWNFSIKNKFDTAVNLGNVVEVDGEEDHKNEKMKTEDKVVNEECVNIVDNNINFANELDVVPLDEGINSSKHKKS